MKIAKCVATVVGSFMTLRALEPLCGCSGDWVVSVLLTQYSHVLNVTKSWLVKWLIEMWGGRDITSPPYFAWSRPFISRCGRSLSTRINHRLYFLSPVCFMNCSMYAQYSHLVSSTVNYYEAICSPYNAAIPAVLLSGYEEQQNTTPTRTFSHSHGDRRPSLGGSHISVILHTSLCHTVDWFWTVVTANLSTL